MKHSDDDDATYLHPVPWRGGLAGYSPSAFAHHITTKLVIERPIAATPAELRLATNIVFRHGEARGLVLSRFIDAHLHLVVATDRREAGMFVRVTECSLRKSLRIPVAFAGARIRPIESMAHGSNAIRYGFTQGTHHASAFDEAHDGSSLPDLLGMRVRSTRIVERVQNFVPRLKREMLLEWLGTDVIDDPNAPMDPALLRDAACAAFGLATLSGRTVEHNLARRAAVQLYSRLAPALSPSALLHLPARTVHRCRTDEATPLEVRAVEKQLRFRTWLSRRPR